jgi:hypothetical protein
VDATRNAKDSSDPRGTDSWGRASWNAGLILILAWAGFLFVPNRLMAYLTTRVTPHARDALVTLWVIVFFVALSWLFVRLQKGRRR